MDLMSKYLGIMKCNQVIISDIATDANIQGVIIDRQPTNSCNKKVFPVDGRISENINHANIPDKSDKTTAQRNDSLPELKPIVRVHTSRQWGIEMQELIEWYRATPKPTGPFYLENHQHIMDPEKFFSSLRQEIQTGPTGPRARMGALQSDLQKLKAYFYH